MVNETSEGAEENMPTLNLKFYTNFCHGASVDAGWWSDLNDCINTKQRGALYSQKIALIHSEVSEMMEGLRKGLMDDHLPDRKMEEVECADILIRVFDYAGARGFDLDGALEEKMRYNGKRLDHKAEARDGEGGKSF